MQLTSGVGFALLSLCFAASNDVVFKRYASTDRSRGMLVMGIGVVWLVLQIATMLYRGSLHVPDTSDLFYGLLCGLFLTGSNLLLLESLKHIDVSLGSTIYRLNTIAVVLLSILWLHESLNTPQWLGIALGLLAIILLYHPHRYSTAVAFIWLAISASLLRALYGILSKQGLLDGADREMMILLTAICWIVGGAAYAILAENGLRLSRAKLPWMFGSGLLVFAIVECLLQAIALGQASIVIPVANMSFIGALLISILLGMEHITFRKSAAVMLAACAVWLLAT